MVASFLVYFLVYLWTNQVVLNSPFIYQTHSQVSDHF